jgi:hypothetical protein
VLGAPGGTSALPADLNPDLQSISRADIRLSVVYPLTAFIRLHAVLGGISSLLSASFTRLFLCEIDSIFELLLRLSKLPRRLVQPLSAQSDLLS